HSCHSPTLLGPPLWYTIARHSSAESMRHLVYTLVASLLIAPAARSQASRPSVDLDSIETMVPMRDGIKLHTTVFFRKDLSENLPIIFVRTPYGIAGGSRAVGGGSGAYGELAQEGYIFAFQDIRGRYKSEGQFVMLRQFRDKKNTKAIDESTDTYDTIAW